MLLPGVRPVCKLNLCEARKYCSTGFSRYAMAFPAPHHTSHWSTPCLIFSVLDWQMCVPTVHTTLLSCHTVHIFSSCLLFLFAFCLVLSSFISWMCFLLLRSVVGQGCMCSQKLTTKEQGREVWTCNAAYISCSCGLCCKALVLNLPAQWCGAAL